MLCSIAQKDVAASKAELVVFPRGQTVFRRLVWCGPSMLSAGAMDGVGGSFTRALNAARACDVAASAAHGSSSEDDGPPRAVVGLPGGVFAQGLDEVSSVSMICSS